jgi:LmbE family N-acetylglucosaminyl deacetylase
VVCITATRGELGFPDDDPRSIEERMTVRERELAACLDVLGVTEHLWLDYPDGGCAAVPDDEAATRLAVLIDEIRPDTVLTFGPEGQTYHEDHIAVSRWTTLACRQATHDPRLLFAVMTPEWIEAIGQLVDVAQVMMVPGVEPPTTPADELSLWFVAEDPILERKVQALECQASQVDGLIASAGRDAYKALNADETFRDPTPDDWRA